MKEVVPSTIEIHGYADDHALKKSSRARSEEKTTISVLEGADGAIKTWMDHNCLKMNDFKTEFIMYGSRQQLSKINTSNIDLNGVTITKSDSIRYLGTDLEEMLSLKKMVNHICRVTIGNLQKLKIIRKCLTKSAATKVVLGLVISHLDYANALYSGLPDIDIKKLQRIQNMAAKMVVGYDRYDSSTAALKALHWLPIRSRIKFKVCTLVLRSL